MIEAIFFDFDGVILDSAYIKTDAFYELYLPYGSEIASQAKAYHLQHQGVSRFKKFEYIHKMFLKKRYSKDEGHALSQKFSAIIADKLANCRFVDGVLDFLKYLKNIPIQSFVLSATPHNELMDICKKRELLFYFSGIFGSPDTKITIGEKIIKNNRLSRDQILFIGDSVSDLEAADHLEVPFLGRVDECSLNPFSPTVKTIRNFCDFRLK